MILLILAATGTALATGLGALPVYWLGHRADALKAVMWGAVAGIMGVASVQGLLLPGFDEGSPASVLGGLAAGVAFLLVARRMIDARDVHLGELEGAGARRGVLVFGVLLVHSLPEGLALGAAWASGTPGLSLFVFLAIALQNVPEGTATSIPLREAGYGVGRAFWASVLTSVPQPLGAVGAFLLVEATRTVLPFSFGFAAGAMLALVAIEVLPSVARDERRHGGLVAMAIATVAMVFLGSLLDVG